MSWTLVHEMNRLTLVYEMNEMKVTRQICNVPLLKYMKNEMFFFFFFESCNRSKYLLPLKHKSY